MSDLEALQRAAKLMTADVDRFPASDQGRRFRAAVAPWLEGHGRQLESAEGEYDSCDSPGDTKEAVRIARAYLGEEADADA